MYFFITHSSISPSFKLSIASFFTLSIPKTFFESSTRNDDVTPPRNNIYASKINFAKIIFEKRN